MSDEEDLAALLEAWRAAERALEKARSALAGATEAVEAAEAVAQAAKDAYHAKDRSLRDDSR